MTFSKCRTHLMLFFCYCGHFLCWDPAYLDQFAFTWIWKGWKHFLILLDGKLEGRHQGQGIWKGTANDSCFPSACLKIWFWWHVSYLSIQHVHTEVTESCLKEIVLCTVFQQSTVHCMCCDLESHQHKKETTKSFHVQ